MALPAVKHLDPVVGVDVHSVLVTPGTPPVFLPHPHVGFMLDLREYVQAAKAVVGCIAMMIVQEKVTEYIEDHPEDVEKLAHLADEANQQVNDLMGGGKLPDFKDDPNVAEGMRLAKEANKIKNRISDDLGSNVGSGGSSGRPIFVNGMMRATAGTHVYHVPGLHFPLGESFAPPDKVEPSNDGESFMGSKTVLANNDPMSYMALEALSCWSVGMEPPPHNSAHTDRTYPSMPSSVMLPIPAGRPVFVGGPPIMNMAAAAKGLFKAFQGSKWAKALADKLKLKPGFLRCNVLKAEPVQVTTGEVVVQQCDFVIKGRLSLSWDRHYASHAQRVGVIGARWQTPADIRLDLIRQETGIGAAVHFTDCTSAFDTLPDNHGWSARVYDWQRGDALYYLEDRFVLRKQDGIEYEFVCRKKPPTLIKESTDDPILTSPISRISDLNGNAWEFERQRNDKLARIIEWANGAPTKRWIRCNSCTKFNENLIESLIFNVGDGKAYLLASYQYDSARNLVATVDAMAHSREFEYTDENRMIRHTSAAGISFNYSYRRGDDNVWRVDRAWGDDGLLDYNFTYDRALMETRVTDSLGYLTILQMNDREIPLAQIDALGGITSYRYDAQWRTSAEIDPAGRINMWKYDRQGRLLERTLVDGSGIRCGIRADGRSMCVEYPDKRKWHYEWDEFINLRTIKDPSGSVSRYEYDATGQLVAYRGPGGAVTSFEYDKNGNVSAIVDHLKNRFEYRCDEFGNVLQVSDANGRMKSYQRDANGNILRIIESSGREVFFGYDVDDNLIMFRDPSGKTTKFEYTAAGKISKFIMPDGSAINYNYDTEAQLIGVSNECGESYQLQRDALGKIVKEIDYWGQCTTYEYSPGGAITKSICPSGDEVKYETDPFNRVIKKQIIGPLEGDELKVEIFEFDITGNLVAAENSDIRIEIIRDSVGRIIEERQGGDFTIKNTYDSAGNRILRRTRLDLGDKVIAHSVRYGYDEKGNFKTIQVDHGAPITIEQSADGHQIVEQLGATLRREQSYSSDGLLVKQALFAESGSMFTTEYSYDNNRDVIEKRDAGLAIERFEYDPMRRLSTHLDSLGKIHRFHYDFCGNLLQIGSNPVNPNEITSPSAPISAWERKKISSFWRCTFNRNGNMVRKCNDTFDMTLRWNSDELLTETIATSANSLASQGVTSTVRAEYIYDPLRRRIGKLTYEPNSDITNNRIQTRDWRLMCSSRFFWDGEVLLAERSLKVQDIPSPTRSIVSGEAREWVYYPTSHRPFIWIRCPYTIHARQLSTLPHNLSMPTGKLSILEELSHFFYNDCNGAPLRVVSDFGDILWETKYAAWGQTHDQRGNLEQPLRLQGQYFDPENGLHYNLHRYYDPDQGAFISQDPIRLLGGVNLYAFSPSTLNWVDPLGLTPWEDGYSSPPNKVKATISILSPGGASISGGTYESLNSEEHAELVGMANHSNQIPKNTVRFEDIEGFYGKGSKKNGDRTEEWLATGVCTMVCRPAIFHSLSELDAREVEFPQITSHELRGIITVPGEALQEAHKKMVAINKSVIERISEETKNYKMVRGRCAARDQLAWFVERGFYEKLGPS
ncbi:type IV secretion protein Rhs [Burkholderia sp. MSMB0856]|uniref:RHS repeat-associated core domain-containing protein n=1 Tax=Burkholderia sp. MSMB0856 TaxID=1637869 RepID=UPI00075CC2FE|nr:RHS repeat-associated core domain-containing protein [Burkholderia sp. MSMB0856]AOJ90459.1 type IV secretion protein Rhs [Burkholderia sp. MSMB0856]KVH34992.1 type IV secretion protein Rhs [Burkholderia sp. MSMB0856]